MTMGKTISSFMLLYINKQKRNLNKNVESSEYLTIYIIQVTTRMHSRHIKN